MSANIFNMEFKMILKPTLFWTFFISFFIFINMLFYEQMIKSGMFDQIISMLKNPFIGNMVKSFGTNPEHLADALGFYAIRNTMVTMMMGSIYAVITSSSLIALEEHDKTAEFLISRPVTRTEIMNSKLLAFQINLFLLNFVSSIIGYISLELFKMAEYSLYSYTILCIYTYLLTLVFASIGLLFSLLVKRGRVFIGAIIAVVFGAYFLEILSNITESANFLGYLSPFKYANKDVLSPNYNLDIWNLLYFIVVSIVLTFISYWIFRKKDIMV